MSTERIHAPMDADERTSLETFLDSQRQTVGLKVAGLSEEDARRRLVGSLTTVAGIVQHLTTVERYWWRVRMAGEDWTFPGWDVDDDADFAVADTTTLADLVADYELACAESRTIAAGLGLDDVGKTPGERGHFMSVRWTLLHLIEETARHNGHLDILRELLDGTTGM
jgi:uncharacterized damage-inducible protein DinB